jgi:hypothetical protein
VGVGVAGGVGIGDGDAAAGLPRAREYALIIVLVIERVRHIAVAVRPAVDVIGENALRYCSESGREVEIEIVAFNARYSYGIETAAGRCKPKTALYSG